LQLKQNSAIAMDDCCAKVYFEEMLFINSSADSTGSKEFLKTFAFLDMITTHSESTAQKYCKESSKSEFNPFSMIVDLVLPSI
jgi:hypothetical protein